MTQTLLVDRKQAAKMAAVSLATWDRMNATGKTPRPIRFSHGCIRWRVCDLEAWVNAGCPNRQTFDLLQQSEK